MKFKLTRLDHDPDGVFSRLEDETGTQVAVTLEHAYADIDGNFLPKVAIGTYTCLRHAPNRLPYETFELQNVPDFQGQPVSGVLIHIGNYDKDSEGCILIGSAVATDGNTNQHMLLGSKIAFDKFMGLLADQSEFTLEIV